MARPPSLRSRSQRTDEQLNVICNQYADYPRDAVFVIRTIRLIAKHFQDQANSSLSPLGLNHAEYHILLSLLGTPSRCLNPSELGESSGEKLANITRLTDQLCARGLITRQSSAEDRRRIDVTLTPEGVALIEKALDLVRNNLAIRLAGFSQKDMGQLTGLLRKLLDRLDANAGIIEPGATAAAPLKVE